MVRGAHPTRLNTIVEDSDVSGVLTLGPGRVCFKDLGIHSNLPGR